jgi:subtilase family serine protease
VQITVPAPPNVDLVVSSCTIEGNTARATIRNTGSEGASFQQGKQVVTFKTDPRFASDFDVTGPWGASGGGYYLPPGGTQDFKVTFKFPNGESLIEITWIVDPNDAVAESNPSNNERTCRASGAPAPTSIAITDAAISVVTAQPTYGPPGTTFEFTVVVKNTGTVSLPSDLFFSCLIDNAMFPKNGYYMTKSLAPNETFTQRIPTSGTFLPGTHVLECTVDPSKKLSESTRNNNARSLVFTVTK